MEPKNRPLEGRFSVSLFMCLAGLGIVYRTDISGSFKAQS